MLIMGFLWLRPMQSADPHKLAVLGLHVAGGLLILILVLLRFALRSLAAGSRLRRRSPFAAAAHRALYALLILIPATGIATAFRAHLPAILLDGTGADLPARFTTFPTFIAHTLLAELLILSIVVHIVSALFHQFVLKDGTLSLMSYRNGAVGRAASAASSVGGISG
jgi:cytochrome b561